MSEFDFEKGYRHGHVEADVAAFKMIEILQSQLAESCEQLSNTKGILRDERDQKYALEIQLGAANAQLDRLREIEQVAQMREGRIHSLEEQLATAKERIKELEAEIHKAQTDSTYWSQFNTVGINDPILAAGKRIDELEAENAKLRKALVGLVGSDDPKELSAMKAALESMPIPQDDRGKTIDAIDALLWGEK